MRHIRLDTGFFEVNVMQNVSHYSADKHFG